MDNWGTSGIGGVIDLICHVLLLVYSNTLDIAGALVVIIGAVALAVFFCNALSII